jgi:hypothetical protein
MRESYLSCLAPPSVAVTVAVAVRACPIRRSAASESSDGHAPETAREPRALIPSVSGRGTGTGTRTGRHPLELPTRQGVDFRCVWAAAR